MIQTKVFKIKSIAISLLLIASQNPLLVRANPNGNSCEVSLQGQHSNNHEGLDDILQLTISYDTKKLGGNQDQVGTFNLMAKRSTLASTQETVQSILNEKIKPAMSDILLGKTVGNEARRLVSGLSTNLLIGEDLKTLANESKSSDESKGTGGIEAGIDKMFKDLESQKEVYWSS